MDPIEANRILHSTLAPTYEIDEPHNRSENREKVRARLSYIASKLPQNDTLIDFGCGTGFILELAPPQFRDLVGIDSTPEMLNLLKEKNLSRLTVIESSIYETDLPDGSADLVTGYSVLDHFADPFAALAEAYRLLRPGGCLYMDLLPHDEFWSHLRNLGGDINSYSEIVQREFREVVHHGEKMSEMYKIEPEVLAAAEPFKELSDGFKTYEVREWLTRIGFTRIEINLEWFLGEGVVLHGQSALAASTVSDHLQKLHPLSSHLFKYIWFAAFK